MKHTVLFFLIVLAAGAACGQGPVLRQADLWTFPYEDLSDLLRLYAGMYPLDYGAIGQPVLFRPWNLNPWELRVDRDGIPQNRHYDGLYDPNLQPANELETIRYDFLGGGGAGRFDLRTRHLPVDSPYTEVQIREGFYGYGTVDFAQGERVYRTTTLELTGRLVYYNGMRRFSASRFRRIRGRLGFDVGKRWRGELSYAGSNDNDVFAQGQDAVDSLTDYSERRDGEFSIMENDSQRTSLSPSLHLFARQDRERWGIPFHAREFTEGSVLEVHASLPDQRFTFRQINTLCTINFPGFSERHEQWIELHAKDSIGVGFGAMFASGSARRESDWGIGIPVAHASLFAGGIEYVSDTVRNVTLHAGTGYTEEIVPMAWRYGSYKIADRPLLIAPEFSNASLNSVPPLEGLSLGRDRYWNSELGLRCDVNGGFVDATAMAIKRPGNFRNHYVTGTDQHGDQYVQLEYNKLVADGTRLGLALNAQIPLKYGLRADTWWFQQAAANDLSHSVDSRAYSRLYFERAFFTTPLFIRAHISWQYYGQRIAYSNFGSATLGPNNVVGFRISATIKGVTAIWGTENLLNETYQILPGYKMIGKEEYLGFNIRLWL